MDVMSLRRKLLIQNQLRFVEYIAGTPGQQMIKTGHLVNTAKSAIEVEWMLINNTSVHVNYVPIFANYIDENTGTFRLILATFDNRYYINSNQRASDATTIMNAATNAKHKLKLTHTTYDIDGNINDMRSGSKYDNDTPIVIFCRDQNTISSNFTNYVVRIYSFKIFDGDNIVANYRPCVKGNKPGIYDTVSKTFYTNAGTGEFIIPA